MRDIDDSRDTFLCRFKQMQLATPRSLTASEKVVLWTLFSYASDDGSNVYPSLPSIVRQAGLSKPTVCRGLRTLIERGYIEHDGVKKHGHGHDTKMRRLRLDRLKRDRKMEDEMGLNVDTSVDVETGLTHETSTGLNGETKTSLMGETITKRSNQKTEPKDSCSKPAQADLLAAEPQAAPKPPAAVRKPKTDTAAGFEVWWAAYPHKVDKQDAAVEYAKALAEGIKPAVLLAALKAYPFSDDPHYQLHPKRWLSKRRWEATTVAPPPPPGQPWIPPRAGTAATQFTGHPWPTRPPRPGMRWIWATASYRQSREDGWCEVSNDTH